jgi:hypothetical protein
MRDLNEHGLITYMPGSQFGMISYVCITRLSNKGELIVDNSLPRISFDTGGGIKTDTATSIKTDTGTGIKTDTPPVSKLILFNKQFKRNKRESKQERPTVDKSVSLFKVLEYFTSAGLPFNEGRKFFFHYEAVGWKMGEMPIVNWQSAAHKWVENIESFKKSYDNGNTTTGSIDLNQNKRYDVPL